MSQRRYHVQLRVRERQQLERYVKQEHKTVNWTFTQTTAREKLQNKYSLLKN